MARNCLLRTATDREEDEDDDQAIPIVPTTEEQDDAMSNEEFQSLLQACGLKKPANEQERFWRIPGHVSPADLRKKVELLQETSTPEVGDGDGEGATRDVSSPVLGDSSSSESDTNKDVEDDYVNSKLNKNKTLEALAQKRRHEVVGKKRKKRVIESNDDELNEEASVEHKNNESDKENERIENEGESSKKDTNRYSLKRVIASDTNESDDDQRLMTVKPTFSWRVKPGITALTMLLFDVRHHPGTPASSLPEKRTTRKQQITVESPSSSKVATRRNAFNFRRSHAGLNASVCRSARIMDH